MKKIYLLAAAAALFAACSSEKDSLETQQQQPAQLEDSAVGFDVYTQRATTRAGWTGSLTTAQLQKKDETPGFGVFGYYTDNNDYEQRATPNFFYNQLVYWNGSAWEYEPVKYWPNEYGNKAVSDESDKVTYFAYAPWVEVIPSSGKIKGADTDKSLEQWGITGMTKNTTQGDPLLKYIASFNTNKSVDLCWGVADNNDGIWPIVQNDGDLNIGNGKPWLNVQRPANVGQKVKFTFKHATAQMRVNIDAAVDEPGHSLLTTEVAEKTRIWVRSVTFKGFALKGTLNLNNDDNAYKPYWLDYNGQNELVAEDVTVYDGRKDGKEGVAGAIATNEKTLGLNPRLIQDGVYSDELYKTVNDNDNKVYIENNKLKVVGAKADGSVPADGEKGDYERPGVTNTTVNLFAQTEDNKTVGGKNDFFHVIPVDESFEVEIVYDVETVSENLAQNLSDGATKGTSIENRIRKTINFGNEDKLQPGHSYTLNLHLGMNSVEFDAAVTDWIDEASQDADLPLNAPVFKAEGTDLKATIPYDAEEYTFGIEGLDGGESMKTVLPSDWSWKDISGDPASAFAGWDVTKAQNNAGTNGIAIETITTKANPTVCNRIATGTWVSGQSGKSTTIAFTQKASPIQIYAGASYGAKNEVTWADVSTITLKTNLGSMTSGWMCKGLDDGCTALDANEANHYIYVKRNGIALTRVAAGDVGSTPDSFSFGNGSGEITLKDKIVAGDVYEVTLKTGDAAAETISIKIVEP